MRAACSVGLLQSAEEAAADPAASTNPGDPVAVTLHCAHAHTGFGLRVMPAVAGSGGGALLVRVAALHPEARARSPLLVVGAQLRAVRGQPRPS